MLEQTTLLEQSVRDQLKQQPNLRGSDINVKVFGEVAALSGTVTNRAQKRAAEELALKVNRIKAVASDLHIKPVSARSDMEIAADILHALRLNLCLPANDVKVTVSGGQVTLEGTVHSQFERLLTEASVKFQRGVTGILNNLEVNSEAKHLESDERESVAGYIEENGLVETGAAEAG